MDAGDAQITEDAVVIGAERYTRGTHGVALALRRADRPLVWIGAEEPDALARVGRALSHYQGMSYVIVANDPAAKTRAGQWEVTHSPLQRALTPEVRAPFTLPPRPPLTATQ
jgi:hypothetical protein